ncbi:hypothetical protein ES703_110432 [subsurface metagenome]
MVQNHSRLGIARGGVDGSKVILFFYTAGIARDFMEWLNEREENAPDPPRVSP